MSLEYVVRPNGPPDVHGVTQIPSTPKNGRQRATLTWGAQATLPQPLFAGINIACCDEDNTELDREGETVRIFGSDGTSFVDVFRANKLHLQKKGDKSLCDGGDSQFSASESFGVPPGTFGFSSNGGATTQENCKVTLNLHNNTTGA